MFKTCSIVQNAATLFKIKHLSKEYVLIMIFGPLGFFKGIFKISSFFLSKENLYLSVFSENLIKNLNKKFSYVPSVSYLINISTLHLLKGYRAIIRVIGVGYKLEFLGVNSIIISLGYSHKINIVLPHFIKIHVLKKRTILWSYSLKCLQQFCDFLFKLKNLDVYNGKGIIQPHLQKKLKIGKISRI